MASIFSKIAEGEIPSYKILEDEKFFSFLDINALVRGHVLVIPKKEIDYIFDIDDSILGEMIVFSKRVAEALKKAIPCKRIGVMVVGLEVPHAHIHLIPLNKESDMNLANKRINFSEKELEQTAQEIRSQLI